MRAKSSDPVYSNTIHAAYTSMEVSVFVSLILGCECFSKVEYLITIHCLTDEYCPHIIIISEQHPYIVTVLLSSVSVSPVSTAALNK